jgi:molybdopterin synthase sulfur carrier subunit
MSVHVYIPTPFRRATGNRDRVLLDAPDVKALLEALEAEFDGLRGLIRSERGEVHPHVNVYVNGEGIDALQGLGTPLRDGDEVSIIPALAGGTFPGCETSFRAARSRGPCGPVAR